MSQQYTDEGLGVILAEDWYIYVVNEADGLIYTYNTEMWPEWGDDWESGSVSRMIRYMKCSKCDVEKAVEFVTLVNDNDLKTADVRACILSPSEVQYVERSLRREAKNIAEMKAKGISYCDFN